MEFNSNNTDFNNTDDSNLTDTRDDNISRVDVSHVVILIIIITGIPLILLAIAAVYFQVRKDHVAPIFIINLLISDVIQLCGLTIHKAGVTNIIVDNIHIFGLMASVGFMVCISLERYLVIAWPMWYRFKRSIKTSLVTCAVVWILPFVYVLPVFFHVDFQLCLTVFAVFLLLPFPFFVFFLVGSIRALSTSRSVPADEKRRIVAILVVVLLIYTLLFLPIVIWCLVEKVEDDWIFFETSTTLVFLSPLADLTLYFFMRKGVTDKLLKSLCCCKIWNTQEISTTTNENMSASCKEAV